MVYNNEVLFIHLGKTGGMSVTNYLCNVLKPPVVQVISEEDSSNLKQAGHEIHHSWKRHANLVQASKYFDKIGMQLSDFKLILIVVRNPVDLDYSYFKHLNTKRYSRKLFANKKNPILFESSKGDYETFALHHFTHYHGKLRDFFEINGSVPKNLKIVKFEELSETIPNLIKPFAIKQIPFPHNNKSDSIRTEKPELSLAAVNSIYRKYKYLYNNIYSTIDPTSELNSNQTNQKDILDKKYLFISGIEQSGISKTSSVLGSHSKIILGVNRYDKLINKDSFSLSINHFTKNRFLNIEEGDTNYPDTDRPKRFNKILAKWENSKLIGLNIKHSSDVFNNLKKNFDSFHYLFVYRDIYNVIKSHKTRLLAEGSLWEQEDLIRIVKQWNQSLKSILNLIHNGERIICLNYDHFIEPNCSLHPIFKNLSLELDSNVILALNKVRVKMADKHKKLSKLSTKENEYIISNYNFEISDILNEKYNILKPKVELEKRQKPNLFLHIGTEKTGSTSIQELLSLNRKELQKQGYAFLKSIGQSNHKHLAMAHVSENKAIEAIDNLELNQPTQRKNWKTKLLNSFNDEMNNLGEHINNVIISSEHFSSILEDIEEIKVLNELFLKYFSSVTIIVYLRRQDLIAVSRRSTAYLSGYPSKQSDFEELEPIPFYDYYNLLNMWEKAMPKALIIPRVFDQSALIDKSLISDFALSLGIDLNSDFKQTKFLNVSLSKSAMDAILLFDYMVKKNIIDTNEKKTQELRLQILNKFNFKYPGPGKKPSQTVARKFLVQYKSRNQMTAQKWFSRDKLFSDDFSMYPENQDKDSMDLEIFKDLISLLTEEPKLGTKMKLKIAPALFLVGNLSFLKKIIGNPSMK